MNKFVVLIFTFLLSLNVKAELINIMPKTESDSYKALLPKVADTTLSDILNSSLTLWYDAKSIVPGYQDSMGDPEGFRPNTIQNILIDAAVPGGWSRLFSKKGKFHFPFASGGADLSSNLVKINFWYPPQKETRILPVVYTRLGFSRWQWLFPVGTVMGEVLMIRLPSEKLAVFEIRTRTRERDKWKNDVFRPFRNAEELSSAIQQNFPQWQSDMALKKLIAHLSDTNTLTPRTLESTYFKGSVTPISGALDILPDFGSEDVVLKLLSNSTFVPAGTLAWKQNSRLTSYAAGTQSSLSIVPINYDAGVLKVDDISCKRCHDQAGRQIGDFHSDLVAYGELWGEDETFSWHPFDTNQFVQANGDVKNFNNDNRVLRKDFVQAKLLEVYQPAIHSSEYYQKLPRTWTYHPFRN